MRVNPPLKCARPHCTNTKPPTFFACSECWQKLPRDIRNRIFSEWRKGDFLHNPAYRDAVVDARKWWDRHPRPVT